MKRILFLTTLMLYLFSFTIFAEMAEDDYTIMVYMNGSTLESKYDYTEMDFRGSATKDLEEMIAGYKGDDNVHVIVQTIGTKRWNNDFVSSAETQRFLLTENGFELQYSLPNQNVGYKKSLSDFIIWTERNYPAKKYGLIMWNHGGGPVNGFGLDEHFSGDRLHLEEMNSALEKAKATSDIHFEFIGFDACIMSSIEIAHLLTPYANYLLASEDLEPSHGWNYTSLLKELHIEPSMTGDTLGKIVGDSYIDQATEKAELYNITFSVIDLSKVAPIVQELDALIKTLSLIHDTPKDFYTFAKTVGKSRNLGGNSEAQGFSDLIDLVDFSKNLSKVFDISTENLIHSVEEAVIYHLDTSRSQNTSGLSIYFPLKDKEGILRNMSHYEKTGFSPTYIDFLTKFHHQMVALTGEDEIEFDINTPNDDTDFYHIKFNEEDLDKIATVYLSVYTVSEDDDLPDHSLKGLGYNADISYDEGDGFYNEHFDKDWIFLDDQPLRLRIMSDTESVIEYESTVIYKNKPMYLLYTFDKTTQAYTLHGLRAGRDPETGKVDKEIYQLKAGDTLTPVYKAYHDKRRRFEWVKGTPVKITTTTGISRKDLEADYYVLSFKFYDYSYKHYQTEFFKFQR